MVWHMAHYRFPVVIQRHSAQRCSQMTGSNKKLVASHEISDNQISRITGELNKRFKRTFGNLPMQWGSFQGRIKRATPPIPSNIIKHQHLRHLYMINLNCDFENVIQDKTVVSHYMRKQWNRRLKLFVWVQNPIEVHFNYWLASRWDSHTTDGLRTEIF